MSIHEQIYNMTIIELKSLRTKDPMKFNEMVAEKVHKIDLHHRFGKVYKYDPKNYAGDANADLESHRVASVWWEQPKTKSYWNILYYILTGKYQEFTQNCDVIDNSHLSDMNFYVVGDYSLAALIVIDITDFASAARLSISTEK